MIISFLIGIISITFFSVILFRYISYDKIQKKEKEIHKIEGKIQTLEKKKNENEKKREEVKKNNPEKMGILEVWEEELQKEEKANS